MLYVMLILVVGLALVGGAEYAMLRIMQAEHKAQVATLKAENVSLKRKLDSYNKLNNIKEGLINE